MTNKGCDDAVSKCLTRTGTGSVQSWTGGPSVSETSEVMACIAVNLWWLSVSVPTGRAGGAGLSTAETTAGPCLSSSHWIHYLSESDGLLSAEPFQVMNGYQGRVEGWLLYRSSLSL